MTNKKFLILKSMLISLKKAKKENGNLDLYRIFEFTLYYNKYKYLLGVGDSESTNVDNEIGKDLGTGRKGASALRILRNKLAHYFDWKTSKVRTTEITNWDDALDNFNCKYLYKAVINGIVCLEEALGKNEQF